MRKIAIILSAAGMALLPAAFLSQAQAGDPYVVTLKAADTSIKPLDTVKLSGKVTPKAAGKTVTIQVFTIGQESSSWQTKKKTTIKSDGTYSTSFTQVEGSFQYRAYKAGNSSHAGDISKPVTVRAYLWYKMANADDTQLDISSGEEWLGRYGSISVAGNTVTKYFATNQTGGDTTRWYTGHNCKQIRVDVGLYDASDTDAIGQFRIFADSDKIASVQVPYGTSIPVDVSFDRAGTGAVKFTGERKNQDAGVTSIVASNPRMLCSFPFVEG